MAENIEGTKKFVYNLVLPETEALETVNSVNAPPAGVSQDTLDHIYGLWQANVPMREICKLVKLEGRNYGRFQEACKYLGIAQEA